MSEVNTAGVIPEVEVAEKAARRQFSTEYKRTILAEADACTREGAIAGLAPQKRGPKAVPPDPRDRKLGELERETRRLTSRLERAEALVELQNKVSLLLGITLPARDEPR